MLAMLRVCKVACLRWRHHAAHVLLRSVYQQIYNFSNTTTSPVYDYYSANIAHVTLTGLVPNQTYYYTFGARRAGV